MKRQPDDALFLLMKALLGSEEAAVRSMEGFVVFGLLEEELKSRLSEEDFRLLMERAYKKDKNRGDFLAFELETLVTDEQFKVITKKIAVRLRKYMEGIKERRRPN
ncbi:MAG: hypothetical protein Q7R54_00635 [bacterium]|nr:hypothetical protein [bacterium]